MQTTMFWSCTGIDASELSFQTARRFSEDEKTLIAEFPCLGIPRLGFVCEIMDGKRNTEAAITRFEHGNRLEWDMMHQLNRRLYILPASSFAVPDYPITARVDADTLMEFVFALHKLALDHGCGRLLLECQGQLNSPMSFFSIKTADHVVIPLCKPTEAAYAVASLRRLAQVYQQQPGKFIIAAGGNIKSLVRAACDKSLEDEKIEGVRFAGWDSRKIISAIEGRASGMKKEKGVYARNPKEERRRRGVRAADQIQDGAPVYL